MLSFKVFLKSRRITDDLAGEVIRSCEDSTFPDGGSWTAIRDYLLNARSAGPQALQAAHRLWLDYQSVARARQSREELIAENERLTENLAQLARNNGTCRFAGTCVARSGQAGPRNALVSSYLHYRIVEFLQPHPGYQNDDGFQPRGIAESMFDGDSCDRKFIAEAGKSSLMEVLAELIANGEVIETPFEPANGDVMLGLPENLGKRKAAYEERKCLIAEGAARWGLRAKWNADGTGWLETPGGAIVKADSSVWDLLSCLNNEALDELEFPELLN